MSGRWYRGGWSVAALAISLLLPACSVRSVPREPHVAELHLEIGDSGGATLDVLLGGDRGQALLAEVPAAIAPAAFPTTASVDVVIDGNDGGRDFAVVRARDVYVPGAAPSFSFDAGSALTVLHQAGYTTVEVTACVPGVPRAFDVVPTPERITESCVRWNVVEGEATPRIHIEMRPEPLWGWLIVGAYVIIMGVAVVGWIARTRARRRHAPGRPASIAAGLIVLVTFAAFATRPAQHGIDNLAVSGIVDSTIFAVAAVVIGIGGFAGISVGLFLLVTGIAANMRPLWQQRRGESPWKEERRDSAPLANP